MTCSLSPSMGSDQEETASHDYCNTIALCLSAKTPNEPLKITQTVAVNGAVSKGTLLTSGVTQEPVLEPLLFVLAFSYIPVASKVDTLTRYADYTNV